MADKIKFALALLVVAISVYVFNHFSEWAMILRVLAVLGGVAVAVAIAWKTEPGQRFVIFANEAVVEARKVVWPSRKETLQTTAFVFAFAVVMALFLWLTDKTLEWVLYDLVLGWRG